MAAANITTLTSFNVDVSAIDNNANAHSNIMLESPIAASMLMNAPIDIKTKQHSNLDCYENERDDCGV